MTDTTVKISDAAIRRKMLKEFWFYFSQNRGAVIGLAVFILLVVTAIFAPLLAPDVEGVAPAWIGLAECDPLVDEGVDYADKLRLAGVPVDLDIYRGVTHEFIKMCRAIPEARKAHADAARAMRQAFGME